MALMMPRRGRVGGPLWLPPNQKPEVGQMVDWDTWGLPGPIGEWWLNENSGERVFDASGNGNHGTLTNGPVWVTTERGAGLRLDGNNDYIDCGVSANLSPLGGFTFVVQLIPDSVSKTHNPGCRYDTLGGLDYFQLIQISQSLQFRMHGQQQGSYIGRSTGNIMVLNTPAQIVGTWDGSASSAGISIYLNGTRVDTGNVSGGTYIYTTASTVPFTLGSQVGTGYYTGTILKAFVFSIALAGSQVAALQESIPVVRPRSYFYATAASSSVAFRNITLRNVTIGGSNFTQF